MALVAAYPVTGRMHQIRQHFQAIGHPVAGDKRYGGKAIASYEGIFLHSFRTALTHPATEESLTVFAPLPAGFLALLRELAGDGFLPLLRGLPEIPITPTLS